MAKAKAKVNIENQQKTVRVPAGTRLLIRRCCEATLQNENFPEPAVIDVSFVDNARIHELNLQFRQVDSATDVLSFPLGENGVYDHDPATGAALLGDVVLSFERAEEQAAQFGHSLQREVGYLTVHSVLHLLGYDHVNGGLEAVRMREKEEAVMSLLGLSREDSLVESPTGEE